MRNPRQNALSTWAVWIETIHGGAHALQCSCRVVSCRVLSCLVLSLRSACLFTHKGSWSSVHFRPRPCSSTCLSMGQARNPPTLGTTLCVSHALMPTLAMQPPHVCHRQRDWAVSPYARPCSRTWAFLRRLHTKTLRSLCLNTVHCRKTTIQKLAIIFPETQFSFDECPNACFFRPARRHMHRIIADIIGGHCQN